MKVDEQIIETFDVTEGKACKIYSIELRLPYYFDPFGNGEHICLSCGGNRDETKRTIEQFNVPHNLVIVNSDEPKHIKVKESSLFLCFLTNIRFTWISRSIRLVWTSNLQERKKFQFDFGFYCNGCGSDKTQNNIPVYHADRVQRSETTLISVTNVSIVSWWRKKRQSSKKSRVMNQIIAKNIHFSRSSLLKDSTMNSENIEIKWRYICHPMQSIY